MGYLSDLLVEKDYAELKAIKEQTENRLVAIRTQEKQLEQESKMLLIESAFLDATIKKVKADRRIDDDLPF